MNGEMTFDFSGYRRLVLAVIGPKLWFFRVFGLVLVAMGVYGLLLDAGTMYGWDLFGGLLMALIYDLATVIGWRRVSGSVSWPWRYEVGGEGIGIHTPQTDTEVRWDGIRRIRTRRDAWVLKLATGATVPVPRAAFSTEDAARIDERFATLVST